MEQRPHMAVRVYSFSPEDQDKLLRETILEWRALGPATAWKAIYDMLDWWFAARGLDPEAQRVDWSHVEVHPVPWLSAESGSPAKRVRSSGRRRRG